MSVWSTASSARVPLAGAEGALVSVSVCVEPSRLEQLLDALAHLEFPINPQLYHEAVLVYQYPDNHEEIHPTTLVEFPAYEDRLSEIRGVLATLGLTAEAMQATPMLDFIRSEESPAPAPAGSSYRSVRRKHAGAAAA